MILQVCKAKSIGRWVVRCPIYLKILQLGPFMLRVQGFNMKLLGFHEWGTSGSLVAAVITEYINFTGSHIEVASGVTSRI